MTIAIPNRMSLEEYLSYDGDTRYELVDGVLVEMGTERRLNEKIALWLLGQFLQWIPVGLIARGTQISVKSRSVTVRNPDLLILTEALDALLSQASQSLISFEMPPPSLVIEVVSPGPESSDNYQRDYVEKRAEYAARRIPEYWIVDPTGLKVTVCILQGDRYADRAFTGPQPIQSPTFPDLALTAGQVLNAGP
jgi:Uma2 family endonuclease